MILLFYKHYLIKSKIILPEVFMSFDFNAFANGQITQIAMVIDRAIDTVNQRRSGQFRKRTGESLTVTVLAVKDFLAKYSTEEIHELGRRRMLGSVTNRNSARFDPQMKLRIQNSRNQRQIRQLERMKSIAEQPAIEIINKSVSVDRQVSKEKPSVEPAKELNVDSKKPLETSTPENLTTTSNNITAPKVENVVEDEDFDEIDDHEIAGLELEEETDYAEFIHALEEAIANLPDEKVEEGEKKRHVPMAQQDKEQEKVSVGERAKPMREVVVTREKKPRSQAEQDRHLDEKATVEKSNKMHRQRKKEAFEEDKVKRENDRKAKRKTN